MVVAFSPGGGTDTLARALGVPLSEALRQSVIVENKPGGSTVIGADYCWPLPARPGPSWTSYTKAS